MNNNTSAIPPSPANATIIAEEATGDPLHPLDGVGISNSGEGISNSNGGEGISNSNSNSGEGISNSGISDGGISGINSVSSVCTPNMIALMQRNMALIAANAALQARLDEAQARLDQAQGLDQVQAKHLLAAAMGTPSNLGKQKVILESDDDDGDEEATLSPKKRKVIYESEDDDDEEQAATRTRFWIPKYGDEFTDGPWIKLNKSAVLESEFFT